MLAVLTEEQEMLRDMVKQLSASVGVTNTSDLDAVDRGKGWLSLAEAAGGGLGGVIEYAAALFDPGQVRALAGHLARLLAGAVAAPGRPVGKAPSSGGPGARQCP